MKAIVQAVAALLTLVILPAVFAEPFHHTSGEWRQYNRDWQAACPDQINEDAPGFYGTSCFASTGSQEKNSANLSVYVLTIVANRLTGATDLAFTIAHETAEVDQTRPLVVAFGSEAPVQFTFGKDLETRHNVSNQFFVSDPKRSAALLDLMRERNALRLTVRLDNNAPIRPVTLSLRGVAASLDFMDAYARKLAQY